MGSAFSASNKAMDAKATKRSQSFWKRGSTLTLVAASVFLLAIWIGTASGFGYVLMRVAPSHMLGVGIGSGAIVLGLPKMSDSRPNFEVDWDNGQPPDGFVWLPGWEENEKVLFVPLWIPILVLLGFLGTQYALARQPPPS